MTLFSRIQFEELLFSSYAGANALMRYTSPAFLLPPHFNRRPITRPGIQFFGKCKHGFLPESSLPGDFIHSSSDGVNNRHRVQRQSVTARRRDRIPCLQACHQSEDALRMQLVSHFFLSIELQVQCHAREHPLPPHLGRSRQRSRSKADR